jgi:hypothetical protein
MKTPSFIFKILSLAGLLIAIGVQAAPTRNEQWSCHDNVVARSGTADFTRCGNRSFGQIACYELIKESCRERISGRESMRQYTRYTGRCANSVLECWAP